MDLTSLYIHIPFCVHRCGYCDFNTYAGLEGLIPAYTEGVIRELVYLSPVAHDIQIHTIYFGGGTPSILHSNHVAAILSTTTDNFSCSPSLEITLEANPGTVSEGYLCQIRQAGVNRLSLGMQSADPGELLMLERQHSFTDVIKAVKWAYQAGFTNLNLDLIFGLPGQSLESWQASLEAALALQPQHLSLYALTLEHGTPLHHKVAVGILPEPDPDLAADMYEVARDRLQLMGYDHYEISNWAGHNMAGEVFACLHNIQYWRGLPYLGVGAGAHGYINHCRTVNVAAPNAYIQRMRNGITSLDESDKAPATPATIQASLLDDGTEMGEYMMMGLRLLVEGISDGAFYQRFNRHLEDQYAPQIGRLVSIGLLEWASDSEKSLRLTRRGQLLGNQAFKEFI